MPNTCIRVPNLQHVNGNRLYEKDRDENCKEDVRRHKGCRHWKKSRMKNWIHGSMNGQSKWRNNGTQKKKIMSDNRIVQEDLALQQEVQHCHGLEERSNKTHEWTRPNNGTPGGQGNVHK